MYHPYQCDICNIYEGGKWLEIVDEMWRNLKADAPSPNGWIYYEHPGSQLYTTMRAGGGEVYARLDCSGCVSAAITLYSIACGKGANTACGGTYSSFSMGSDWSDPPNLGFTWFDGDGPWLPGDIQVCIAHHVQIVDENGNAAYSGGGELGLNKGGPSSSLNFYIYDGGWRYNGDVGSASGGSGSGLGGFSSPEDDDDTGYINTGCTVYGNTSADDKGNVTGWNSIHYLNIPGCHVAIPKGQLNSVWHYGDLVRLKYHNRTVDAVVADCGNFGTTGKYNHFATFDLPPNTQRALGIYNSVKSGLYYKRIGHINSWHGEVI